MFHHHRCVQNWLAGCVVLSIGLVPAFAQGAEWGTIKGRFVYTGKAPEPMKLRVDKDAEVCSKHPPVDETLVVGEDGGLANVVISLRPKPGETVPVHSDYEQSASAEVVIDNLHCRFEPRVALLRTSQTLVLKNSDAVVHNTKADFFANNSFNILIPANNQLAQKVTRPERTPAPIGCNIHPWMKSWLLVRDDPYMAVSAADGTFEIKNVPVGEREFQLWQEKSGFLEVTIGGSEAKRGRFTLKVAPGENDLGEIKVDPALFEGK